jgi:AcrR family transcriptional regulator
MDKEKAYSDILQSSLTLFSLYGYDGVSLSDIYKAAKVSASAFKSFFENKQAVYSAIWEEYFGNLYNALKDAAIYRPTPEDYERDVYGTIFSIFTVVQSYSIKFPEFFAVLKSIQFAPEKSEAKKLCSAYYDILINLLSDTFFDIGKIHGTIQGNESSLANSLISQINCNIDLEPAKFTRRFMHGIFC